MVLELPLLMVGRFEEQGMLGSVQRGRWMIPHWM
jgi:hypothetical protein